MEPFDRLDPEEGTTVPGREGLAVGRRRRRKHRPEVPAGYRFCDGVTEAVIYFMVVFTPWAFGTTQEWSIWTMTVSGYVLGLLLATKHLIRWRTGFEPPRWGGGDTVGPVTDPVVGRGARWTLWVTRGLAVLTVLILAYVLVSALNARAVYLPGQRRFEYFDTIKWLPQSYDAASTWRAFFSWSGLACYFWALRDWLLGRTEAEDRRRERGSASQEELADRREGEAIRRDLLGAARPDRGINGQLVIPVRLRRLLWILCVNGAVLAVEGILQRLSGTNRLLWLVVPVRNSTGDLQFGPYAYRSNAAQYFNLSWPVCLGFWLHLRNLAARAPHRIRLGAQSHVLLLPMAVLMAVCPIISTSRGGALISMALVIPAVMITLRTLRGETRLAKAGVMLVFGASLALGVYLGGARLAPRLMRVFEDRFSNRPEIYANAQQMAHDFPGFGIGAGAFGSVYQLYRSKPTQIWAGYVHDDWLETRITLGWVGFVLVIGALAMVVVRGAGEGGVKVPATSTLLMLMALVGCLVHARFDFPFQIYSLLFLFLTVSSLIFASSPRTRA